MQVDYESCKNYIQNVLHIEMFDYQWMMLKAFCEGMEVRTARGIERTYEAEAFGKYIAHLYGRNNYYATPKISFGYQCAVPHGLYDDDHIRQARERLTASDFRKEYLCVAEGD